MKTDLKLSSYTFLLILCKDLTSASLKDIGKSGDLIALFIL